VLNLARRGEADVRRRAEERIGQVTLALIDAALASPSADRATERVLASDLAERAVARALSGQLVEVVARDLVRFDVVQRVTERVLDGDAVDRALESPAVERIVTQIVESHVVQEAVARVADDAALRLRTSEAMWTLIEDIAQSPTVTEAITQQGAGFADQVGDDIRERSRQADVRLERAARRLFGRRAASSGQSGAPSGRGAT
jgi:hypothetical protein